MGSVEFLRITPEGRVVEALLGGPKSFSELGFMMWRLMHGFKGGFGLP